MIDTSMIDCRMLAILSIAQSGKVNDFLVMAAPLIEMPLTPTPAQPPMNAAKNLRQPDAWWPAGSSLPFV
jgi:hypothetical protein